MSLYISSFESIFKVLSFIVIFLSIGSNLFIILFSSTNIYSSFIGILCFVLENEGSFLDSLTNLSISLFSVSISIFLKNLPFCICQSIS